MYDNPLTNLLSIFQTYDFLKLLKRFVVQFGNRIAFKPATGETCSNYHRVRQAVDIASLGEALRPTDVQLRRTPCETDNY